MTTETNRVPQVCSFIRDEIKEFWLNCAGDIGAIADLNKFLVAHNAQAVSVRLFGAEAVTQRAAAMFAAAQETSCPPLILEQNRLEDGVDLAVQVQAISGAALRPLYYSDEFVGWKAEVQEADYFMLSVLPDYGDADEYEQAVNLFDKIHRILQHFGAGFSNVIRTWLYARNILDWYDELNRSRNDFFERHDIYHQLVPASTGIGAANPQGRAIATQVLAVVPKHNRTLIRQAHSPLQCPALNYRSSFSRAISLLAPGMHRLYISGTASINASGQTVNIDDTSAQINLTMQVLEAILKKAGMNWGDAVSSLAYFKHREDFALFDDYCRKHHLALPHIKLHADICRADLLFELELDAVKA